MGRDACEHMDMPLGVETNGASRLQQHRTTQFRAAPPRTPSQVIAIYSLSNDLGIM